MNEAYGTLPPKYAESLLYVDLVDVLSAYRKFSRLSSLSRILGVRESSLSKYVNGRLRPRPNRCLSLVRSLTSVDLVRGAVMEYLRDGGIVELLTDVHFTKLIALAILGKIVEVFRGSRVETIITSSEALLIASHVSHRLKSPLLNIHVARGTSRMRNLGNTAVILVMADEEVVRQLARVKAESRRTDVKYIFAMIYSAEAEQLASTFPNAVVDCLIMMPQEPTR